MECLESTVVRYLMQGMSHRPYTLECTQQTLVSGFMGGHILADVEETTCLVVVVIL